MSIKPSAPFQWCTTGDDVLPSTGKRAVGFVPRERVPAEILNRLLIEIGEWTQYVSDGSFQGVHTFNDDVEMSANLQVDGDIVVGDDLTVVDDVVVGSDLDVIGGAEVGSLLVNGGAEVGSLLVNGATTSTGLITANNGVTIAIDKNLKLSTTSALSNLGVIQHGKWTKTIPANVNAAGTGATFVVIDGVSVFAWSIMLDAYFQFGDVITDIRVNVTDNATGPTRASASFLRFTDGSGSPATIAGPVLSTGTPGGLHQIVLEFLNETIATGKTHTLKVAQSGGTASLTLWSIDIDWTH